MHIVEIIITGHLVKSTVKQTQRGTLATQTVKRCAIDTGMVRIALYFVRIKMMHKMVFTNVGKLVKRFALRIGTESIVKRIVLMGPIIAVI